MKGVKAMTRRRRRRRVGGCGGDLLYLIGVLILAIGLWLG